MRHVMDAMLWHDWWLLRALKHCLAGYGFTHTLAIHCRQTSGLVDLYRTKNTRQSKHMFACKVAVHVHCASHRVKFLQRAAKLALQALYMQRLSVRRSHSGMCVKTRQHREIRSSPSHSLVTLVFCLSVRPPHAGVKNNEHTLYLKKFPPLNSL